ncbi:9823_t:CDS:2 [Ambispora leptoticha]|uniref:9823_t:CDS:1 n=1 Tax=Ambispora leptoticha TaxID=144679 RepID=A0A9N9D7D6_9GLOM|nr:9823_t:CDS:2 [Ambispora leptoticha]
MKVFPETSKHLKSLDTMIYYATDGSSGTHPLVLHQNFDRLLSNGEGKSNALFNHVLRDGKDCCKIKSLEVFRFLQKYADDTEINIIYPAGETFDENEVQIPGNNPIVTPSNPLTNNNMLVELTIKKITKGQDGNYQDLLQETKYLVNAGFKKDGEEYKLYQDLKQIAADFSIDRVGGRPVDLYPSKSGMDKFTGPWRLAFAYTS